KRIDSVEIYRAGGEFFEEVTGASGTLADLNPVLQKIYGLEPAHEVGRSQTHRLVEGVPDVVESTHAKLRTIAEYANEMRAGGEGRYQQILCHRNDLVERQVDALVRAGVPRDAIEAVDARRIIGWGADWEAQLQRVFDSAGEQGKILVINRQGQRGVDISVSDAVQAQGGMHVWMTEAPEQSYIHEQAKNRTARNGDRGSAQVVMSPQDELIRNAMHLRGVREAVVHYEQAVAAHAVDPTPQTHDRLVAANNAVRELTPELQQRALRHSTAEFIRHHAFSTALPVLTLAETETGHYRDGVDFDRPDEPADRTARLAGLLGLPAPAMEDRIAALERDGAVEPLRELLERSGIAPAAVEALRQQVEATAPAIALQRALFTDEQALDHLTPLRNRLAAELGVPIADIEGAEGMRVLEPRSTEARDTLAAALGYPAASITPALARDILGEVVGDHLTGTNSGPADTRDNAAEAVRDSGQPGRETPEAVTQDSGPATGRDIPDGADLVSGPASRDIQDTVARIQDAGQRAAEDIVAAASRYLALAALLDSVVQIHRRSPNSCVNNAVTGMRVLCPGNAGGFRMPAANLEGHDRETVRQIFGAGLAPAESLDQVAESLKSRPGGITVLVYKWKDTRAAGRSVEADDHMVLLVNDSTSVDDPNLVVVDLAASPDRHADTDYGPADLRNRRTLLNKAADFEEWRREQQVYLNRLSVDQRRFETIEFDRDGNLVPRLHPGAPSAEILPPSRQVVVTPAMVDEINAAFDGRPGLGEPAPVRPGTADGTRRRGGARFGSRPPGPLPSENPADPPSNTAATSNRARGEWITARRHDKGRRDGVNMTASDLARAVGVDRSTLSRIEQGSTRPRPGLFVRIGRALGVPRSELLAAAGDFYPDADFDLDPAAYPVGAPGRWLAAMLHDRDISWAKLADDSAASAKYLSSIGRGEVVPVVADFRSLCQALNLGHEVTEAAAGHFFPGPAADLSPAAYAPGKHGQWLRAHRDDHGVSRDELARAAGISAMHLRSIEAGDRNPGVVVFLSLCDALNIEADMTRRAAGRFFPHARLDIDWTGYSSVEKGLWFTALRYHNRLARSDVADDTGLSEKYIGQIERGERIPSGDTFRLLGRELGIGPLDLNAAQDHFTAAALASEAQVDSVRAALAGTPLEPQTAAAVEVVTAMQETAEGIASVRTTLGGEGDARWVTVEVGDRSRATPKRDQPDKGTGLVTVTRTGRLLQLFDEKSRTWGLEIHKNGDRTRRFTLATPAVPDGPLHAVPDPEVDLVFTREEVGPSGGVVRRSVVDLLRRADWDESRTELIRVAVSEVFGNVDMYAKEGGARVRMWFEGAGDELVVEIADESRGTPGWKFTDDDTSDERTATSVTEVVTDPADDYDPAAADAFLDGIDLDALMANELDGPELGADRTEGTHGRGGVLVMATASTLGYELAAYGAPGKTVVMRFPKNPPDPQDKPPGRDSGGSTDAIGARPRDAIGSRPARELLRGFRERRAARTEEQKNLTKFVLWSGVAGAGSAGAGTYLINAVQQTTGSVEMTGLASALMSSAALAATLPGGMLVDRNARQWMMRAGLAGSMAAGGTALYAGLGLPGTAEALIGAGTVMAATAAVYNAGVQAYGPSLISTPEGRKAADTLMMIDRHSSGMVGRFTWPVMANISAAMPLWASTATGLANWRAMRGLPDTSSAKEERPSMREIARTMWNDRYMRYYQGLLIPWGVGGSALGVQLAALMDEANYSPQSIGMVAAGGGIGALAGAALKAWKSFREWIKDRTLGLTFGSWMIQAGTLAATDDQWLIAGSVAATGATVMLNNIDFAYYLRNLTGNGLGQGWSITNTVNQVSAIAGSGLVIPAVATFGRTGAGLATAGMFAGATAAALALENGVRRQWWEELRDDCLDRTARILHGLGKDDATAPSGRKRNYRTLEKYTGGTLVEYHLPTDTAGEATASQAPQTPGVFGPLIDQVKNADQTEVDTMDVLVDDGGKTMHVFTIVNTGPGQAIIFDTNIKHAESKSSAEKKLHIPRVIDADEFTHPYETILRIHTARYRRTEDGTLEDINKDLGRRDRGNPPRDQRIAGPPEPGDERTTPEKSTAAETEYLSGGKATVLLVEAVAAAEPQLLQRSRARLAEIAPERVEVFDRYFLRGQSADEVAGALGRPLSSANRAIDRVATLLAGMLPPGTAARYTGGGVLRRATHDDIARESHVPRPMVAKILAGRPVGDSAVRDAVRAAARKLRYQPIRSGVVVDYSEAAPGPRSSPVPAVSAPRQEPAAAPRREPSALSVVRAAPPARLAALIPKLPEADRDVATRVFVDKEPVRELAADLNRSVGSLTDHQRRIAVRLNTLLSGRELLIGAEAVAAVRRIQESAPEILRPSAESLSEPMRRRYERFFVHNDDARTTAAAAGGNQYAVEQWARSLAEEWLGKLPPNFDLGPQPTSSPHGRADTIGARPRSDNESTGAHPSRVEYDGAEIVPKFHPEVDNSWKRQVEIVVLGENENGSFTGDDGKTFATGRGDKCFLVLRNGSIVTTKDGSAEHPNLLYSYISTLADENERSIYHRIEGPSIVAGGGYWRLVDGRPEKIGFFSGMVIEHATRSPKFWAQSRHRLSQNFDLSRISIDFDDNHVGGAWRNPPDSTEEYSAETFVRNSGSIRDRPTIAKNVAQHLRGGNEKFWFEVENIAFPRDGGLSIDAVVHPVLGEPGELTIEFGRGDTPETARYERFDPGLEPERTVAAFRIVHEILTQWLGESGIVWSADAAFEAAVASTGSREGSTDAIGAIPGRSTGNNDSTAPPAPTPWQQRTVAEDTGDRIGSKPVSGEDGTRDEPPRDLSALSEDAHAALAAPGAELRDLGSTDQIAERLIQDDLPGQTAVVLELIDGVERARTLVYDGRRVVEVRDPDTDDGMLHEFEPGSIAAEQTHALVYSPVDPADRAEAEQALGRLLGRYDSDRFPERYPGGIPDRPARAAAALDFDRPRTIAGPLPEDVWSTLAQLYPHEVSSSRGAPESARTAALEVWGNRYFPWQPVPADGTPAEYLARRGDEAIATYSNTYRAGDRDGIHGWVDEEGVLLFQIGAAEGTPSGQEMFRDMMSEIGSQVRAIRAPWSAGDSHTDNLDTFNAYLQDLQLSPEDAARRTFTGKMAGELGFTEVTVNHLLGPHGEHLIVDVTFSEPGRITDGARGLSEEILSDTDIYGRDRDSGRDAPIGSRPQDPGALRATVTPDRL
ncbi:helix-turn-helix domain-containing protein, partial [Nocardia sp. NPDC003345]